jgi:hypothetical protein
MRSSWNDVRLAVAIAATMPLDGAPYLSTSGVQLYKSLPARHGRDNTSRYLTLAGNTA